MAPGPQFTNPGHSRMSCSVRKGLRSAFWVEQVLTFLYLILSSLLETAWEESRSHERKLFSL